MPELDFSAIAVPEGASGATLAATGLLGPNPDVSSFHDLLASLNPLQHLPGVGMIYRAITGETISPSARIAGSVVGSVIAGGPLGVLGTVATLVAERLFHLGGSTPAPVPSEPGTTAFAEAGAVPPVPAAHPAENPSPSAAPPATPVAVAAASPSAAHRIAAMSYDHVASWTSA